jgi:4-amino-4-deoxy-L-arabinose transferase-like glycosyltransferase
MTADGHSTRRIEMLRSRMKSTHIDLPLLVLLAVILVVRVLWAVLSTPPVVEKDSAFYEHAARWFMDSGAFAIGDSMRPSAWVMPGYAFFLGILHWVFGTGSGSLVAIRVVQAVLSVLTIYVLYRLTLRLRGGRRLGLTFVVLAGLYPPFTFASSYILTEVLYTFLLCLLVLFGIRLIDTASWSNAIWFGVALALSTYVRPAGVLWAVIPFLLLLRKVPFRRVAAVSAVALVVFCVCMSPWWIRNAQVYDRFVPFSTSGSDTMLKGTYEMFTNGGDQAEQVPAGILVWSSAEMQNISVADELEAGAKYKDLAYSRIKEQLSDQPGKFVYGRLNAVAGSFRGPYFLPSLPGLVKKAAKYTQFLLLILPAILAVVVGIKNRKILLLASLPVVIGIIYTAILISPRYVYPLMPVVVLLASSGWLWIYDLVRARAPGRSRGTATV